MVNVTFSFIGYLLVSPPCRRCLCRSADWGQTVGPFLPYGRAGSAGVTLNLIFVVKCFRRVELQPDSLAEYLDSLIVFAFFVILLSTPPQIVCRLRPGARGKQPECRGQSQECRAETIGSAKSKVKDCHTQQISCWL